MTDPGDKRSEDAASTSAFLRHCGDVRVRPLLHTLLGGLISMSSDAVRHPSATSPRTRARSASSQNEMASPSPTYLNGLECNSVS